MLAGVWAVVRSGLHAEKCGQGSVGKKCEVKSVGRRLGGGKRVGRNALRSAARNVGNYMCAHVSIFMSSTGEYIACLFI